LSRKKRCISPKGEKPRKVNGQMASRTNFYKGVLYRIIKGLFEIECPKEWNIDYLLDMLILDGYVLITDTQAGILPVRSALTGYNYCNFPVSAKIVVPMLGEFDRTLSEDAEIVYLEWSRYRRFYNFQDMVDIFSQRLASCDCGIDVNIMNSRLAYIAEAESRSQADTIKRIMDDVSEGEPLVVYRDNVLNATPMQLFFNNLKQNFIATELLDAKRSIINEFLTLLGVNNANTDKKERLITNEVDANNEELAVNIGEFESNLERCNNRINSMFPDLDFSLRLKFDSRTRKEYKDNDIFRTDKPLGHSKPNS